MKVCDNSWIRQSARGGFQPWTLAFLSVVLLPALPASAEDPGQPAKRQRQVIPILATALDHERNPVGVVAQLEVTVEHRRDHNGMNVRFETEPGRFSPATEVAVVAAILNVARVAHVSTDSLSVSLAVPYHGVTVYGTSLSAMVGLTVVALAHGDAIKPSRVLTGTINPDGHIGAVGGIALKLEAAQVEHFRRVLVPEEYDVTDGDWDTPFLLHVSPVSSVGRAYQALTDAVFPGQATPDSVASRRVLADQATPRSLTKHVVRAMSSHTLVP